MANQKTSIISNKKEKVLLKPSKAARKGRPAIKEIHPDNIWYFVTFLNKMASRYHIEYGGFQMLSLLHWLWERNRKGISISSIVPYVDWYNSGNTHVLVNERIGLLVKRGLVEVVGKGRYNCKLYAPTVNALRDMVEIISKLD